MAATTMAILNVKSFKAPPTTKTATLLPITALPKGLTMSSNPQPLSLSLSATAIAGAVFSTLSTSEPAMAVQQIAELAEGGDNRGQLLLIVVAPAIVWVLYNILQPALNQLNRMRSTKGVIAGLGLGALGASGFMFTPEASAASEAAAGDNRGQLLLLVVAPAILWVLYNILQPALNQLNKMRND